MATALEAVDSAVVRLADTLGALYIDLKSWTGPSPQATPSQRLLYSTSVHAAGVWHPGDPIRLVCKSTNTTKVFWEMAAEKLSLDKAIDLNAAIEAQQLELPFDIPCLKALDESRLAGTKFYLLSLQQMTENIIADGLGEDATPLPAARNYYLLADTMKLLECTGDKHVRRYLDDFHQTYELLRKWAIRHGILCEKFGMWNSDCLLWLVWKDYDDWFKTDDGLMDGTDSERLACCLMFCKFIAGPGKNPYQARMIIRTPSGQNAAAHVTKEGTDAVLRASRLLRHAERVSLGAEWFVLDADKRGGFVKLEAETWAQSVSRRKDFFEITVPALLLRLADELRGSTIAVKWFARIWPWPINQSESSITYIAAVRVQNKGAKDEELLQDWTRSLPLLRPWLEAFAKSVNADASEWVAQIEILNQSEVDALEPLIAPSSPIYAPPQIQDSVVSQVNALKINERSTSVDKRPSSSPARFRTADQAISRLRYDPGHSGVAYEVGYLDRFDGILWMALEKWGGKATEEEDFIPQSRLRKIRRKQDQAIVWDREARIDIM